MATTSIQASYHSETQIAEEEEDDDNNEQARSGITSGTNWYTNVLILASIRSIRTIVLTSPISLSDIASIPN